MAKARERARESADGATRARQREQRAADEDPRAAQTVRMTLLKGWEVATGWAALVQALGAAGRKRHEQLTTTTVHVPGQEEPRVIKRNIPLTFGELVERAGQDNNHLQKAVNVHESALTWRTRGTTPR